MHGIGLVLDHHPARQRRPWKAEADEQNRSVLRSCSAAAATFAAGGYPVVLEGIFGPWYLDIVTEEFRRRAVDASYVVLRPRLEVAIGRATARAAEVPRTAGHPPLTDEEPIRHMWGAFAGLGPHERHVLDTSDLDAEEVAERIVARWHAGELRLA